MAALLQRGSNNLIGENIALTAQSQYAAERDWLVTAATEREKDLIWVYTAESSRFNVACLLSGVLPEVSPAHMQQHFKKDAAQRYQGNFAQYKHDLLAAFNTLVRGKPQDLLERVADIFVYRTIYLFELTSLVPGLPMNQYPYQTVFNAQLPFPIRNNTFCSTSVDLPVSKKFLKASSPCCLLEIRIPPEFYKFLAIEKLSNYPSEREILFPPESAFIVKRRTFMRNDNGRHVLVLHADVTVPSPRYIREARKLLARDYVDLSPLAIMDSAQSHCLGSDHCGASVNIEKARAKIARRGLELEVGSRRQ
jgi:hypothetical protein